MTPPVVAVVGLSNSGKTTVAERLVHILTAWGYRVAAVKHCPHGHEIGRSGTDTHRLFESGACAVVASSPGLVSRSERVEGDLDLESIVAALDADIVIAEGFKSSAAPKIVVGDPQPVEGTVIAYVTELPGGPDGPPTYSRRQLDGLAAQIRRYVSEATPTPLAGVGASTLC